MEIDWVQRQVAGYARDSQRILQCFQEGDSKDYLANPALELLHTYLAIPSDVPDRDQADENIARLAQILYIYVQAHGHWKDICVLWPKLQSITKSFSDPTIYAELVKQLAVVKNDRGEVREAQALYEELMDAASFSSLPPEQRADLYHKAAVCYYTQGNYARARALLLQCLTLHDPPDDFVDSVKNSRQRNSAAFLRTHTATPPMWESKAYSFNELGNIALGQGNFKAAQQSYDKCLHILVQHGEAENLACVAYQALGSLYVIQRRFNDALPLLKKNLYIRQQRKEAGGSAYAAIYLAAAYIGLQQFIEAESFLNEAMETSSTLQNRPNIAFCHLYFGYLAQRRGSRQAALRHWRQAQATASTIPAPGIELQVLAPLLTELLLSRCVRELRIVLMRLGVCFWQQRLSPVAAVRLLIHYLRW
jgi:tetratricopeptide (TPR) repeat protein